MAKYAELYFAEQEEDIPIGGYLMKLPINLRNKVIKWKLALKSEEKMTWGVMGEKIQLPMTYSIYKSMTPRVRSDLFKKMEKKLKQNDITHVILPTLINTSPFETIQACTGNYIKPFFVMEIIRYIAKERLVDKKLQHLEVIILDGNRKDVDMMIDLIYPHINHLTIITHSPNRFKQKAEEIFEDVGLNMQILSNTKGAISQGDIIIDTHYDDPSVIGFCKAKTLYLDMGNHAEKTIMLIERGSSACVVDQFLLKKQDQIVNSTQAEVLLTMKEVFTRDYKQTMQRLKKQKIEVFKLN